MIGKMYDIPKKLLKERILKILEKLQLTDKKDELVSSLSGGMKRRMNIAMATIHNPSIVVLDEPSEDCCGIIFFIRRNWVILLF